VTFLLLICCLWTGFASRLPSEEDDGVVDTVQDDVWTPSVGQKLSRVTSIAAQDGEDFVLRLKIQWDKEHKKCTIPARFAETRQPDDVADVDAESEEAVSRAMLATAQSVVAETAEAEFEEFVQNLETPTCDNESYEPKLRVFTFAIGSIFNDESRRSSKLKNGIFKGGIDVSLHEDGLSDDEMAGHFFGAQTPVVDALHGSRPSCPRLATINRGFSRRWCYPSGRSWNIWAVSLHIDEDAPGSVLGGLVDSDKETFVLMRPREENYDVLAVPAEEITLASGGTLRQMYPCDPIFVVAYGYKKVFDSIVDVFDQEPRIKNHQLREYQRRPNVSTAKLCDLMNNESKKAACVTHMLDARGHVIAQSYIDVIISGILQNGYAKHVGQFQVWGGQLESKVKMAHVLTAMEFVKTTVWPVKDVQTGRVLYINDRKCPRNPNPIYTPLDRLVHPHKAGTSSAGADVEETWGMIDKIMAKTNPGKAMLDERVNADLCDKLEVLPRWTDEVLSRGDSIWDAAYKHADEIEQKCS
jgi:hypothetical protein